MNTKIKSIIGLVLNSVMAVFSLVVCTLGSLSVDMHWSVYLIMALLMLGAMVYDAVVIAPKFKESVKGDNK